MHEAHNRFALVEISLFCRLLIARSSIHENFMVHSWASGGKFRKRGKIIHQPVVCSMPLDRIKSSKVRLGIVSTLVSKRTQPPGRLIFRKIKHRFDTWITISRAQSVVMKAFYHPFHPDRKMHATAQKYQLMDRFERV